MLEASISAQCEIANSAIAYGTKAQKLIRRTSELEMNEEAHCV
jgi:hypothetical protein